MQARVPFAAAWTQHGLWSDATLAERIRRGVAMAPDTRLIFGSRDRSVETTTTGEVYAQSLQVAAAFKARGFAPGDVIVLQVPHWRESLVAFIAAQHLGMATVPAVSIYGPTELGFILRQSRAKVLVIPDSWRKTDYAERVRRMENLPHLEHIIVIGKNPVPGPVTYWEELAAASSSIGGPERISADDVCIINFTSGSTASPKGVIHSHKTFGAAVFVHPLLLEPGEPGASFSELPAGHVAGLIAWLRPFLLCEHTVYVDHWDGELAVEMFRRHAISRTSGAPLQINYLLDHLEPELMGRIKHITTGATSIAPDMMQRCEKLGAPASRIFGTTEHPTVAGSLPADPLNKRIHTDGRIMAGGSVRIVDDDNRDVPSGERGEIWTMGPQLFLGYLDADLNAGAFTPDGWFRTGDIGILDADGFLSVVDRKKDIIIRGGENISSKEVEDLLAAHPAVAEAAAVAWPDARLGEKVGVFVRTRPGAHLDLPAIIAHFQASGVARHKTPEYLVVVADFPRTSVGKILKTELRKRVAELQASKASQ
jgi:acyl-CoA synthetase (AMP-forming)/AMP-acid ligase II